MHQLLAVRSELFVLLNRSITKKFWLLVLISILIFRIGEASAEDVALFERLVANPHANKGHLGSIEEIAAAPDHSYVVSVDKSGSAIIWSVHPRGPNSSDWELTYESLLLLPRSRRPGHSGFGMIHSVSISHNSNFIAVGGTTPSEKQGYSVYVFDKKSTLIVEEITGLPHPIESLAFSPDGDKLAIGFKDDGDGFSNGKGVIVWSFSRGGAVDQLDHGSTVRTVQFTTSGDLLTLSGKNYPRKDGSLPEKAIRLFRGAKNASVIKQRLEHIPHHLAYSSATDRIAITYSRYFDAEPRVDFYKAGSLENDGAYVPSDLKSNYFSYSNWTEDGRHLVLTGQARNPRSLSPLTIVNIRIVEMAEVGDPFGNVRDIFVNVKFLDAPPAMLGGGRFAVADSERSVFVGSISDDQVRHIGGQLKPLEIGAAEYFLKRGFRQMRVSRDGMTLAGPVNGKLGRDREDDVRYFRFSLDDLSFRVGEEKNLGLAAFERPIFSNPAGGPETKLFRSEANIGTNTTFLDPAAEERAAAIDYINSSKVVLGTTKNIIYFEEGGARQVWKKPIANGVAQLVAVPESNILVVADREGFFEWRRLSDGELLANFYFARARGDEDLDDVASYEWAAWGSDGYLVASSGGYDLVGLRLEGKDRTGAVINSAASFGDALLGGEKRIIDAIKGAKENPKRRPPKLGSRSLTDNLVPKFRRIGEASVFRNRIKVKFDTVSIGNGEIDRYSIFVNEAKKRYAADFEKGELVIFNEAPSDGNAGGLTAMKNFDASCGALNVRVISFRGDAQGEAVEFSIEPEKLGQSCDAPVETPRERTLYGLFVGAQQFNIPYNNLNFTENDATEMHALFEAQEGLAYDKVDAKLLIRENATASNIIEEMDKLIEKERKTNNDVVMIYLAGHGMQNQYGTFLYLPNKFNVDKNDTYISANIIRDKLESFSDSVNILAIDACFDGGPSSQPGEGVYGPFNSSNLTNELTKYPRTIVLTSSSDGQPSWESPNWGQGHGAFTYALLEALRGRRDADDTDLEGKRDGRIVVREVRAFLEKTVPLLVKEEKKTRQVPNIASYKKEYLDFELTHVN